MSQWTHVAGCIRIDDFQFSGEDSANLSELTNLLGRIVEYDDETYETTLPCGSEGSIKYEIVENSTPHSVARYAVVLYGDLRDFSDVQYLKSWFFKFCEAVESKSDSLSIRSAVMKVDVEGLTRNFTEIFQYNEYA